MAQDGSRRVAASASCLPLLEPRMVSVGGPGNGPAPGCSGVSAATGNYAAAARSSSYLLIGVACMENCACLLHRDGTNKQFADAWLWPFCFAFPAVPGKCASALSRH